MAASLKCRWMTTHILFDSICALCQVELSSVDANIKKLNNYRLRFTEEIRPLQLGNKHIVDSGIKLRQSMIRRKSVSFEAATFHFS